MAANNTSIPADPQARMDFADKLKVALTMLVIAHHAAQPYGATGGAWPIDNARHSMLLEPFFAVNAAFFMGLFCLVSGFFVPQSYDKKGAAGFLKTRFKRLGIPTAVYALFFTGPITYLALFDPGSGFALFSIGPAEHLDLEHTSAFVAFLGYLYDHAWLPLYDQLWFLLHLLLYGSIYVLWRRFGPSGLGFGRAGKHPTHGQILIYLLALITVTWVVRIWYPVDRWVPLFFLIPSEIAHLPQYFSLFMIGVLAARHDWPRRTPAQMGMLWLKVGLVAAVLFYIYRLAGMAYLPVIIAKGGASWQSLVWCAWEACICVGLCVGLPVWFRERFNRQPGGLGRAMIVAAYGAYIVHFLLVIALQIPLRTAPLPPLAKFALVTMAGIVLSFALAHALRRIPGFNQVL